LTINYDDTIKKELQSNNGEVKMKLLRCMIILFLLAVLTLILPIMGCVNRAAKGGWPRWRGPNGDGISLETDWDPGALNGSPKVVWHTDIGFGHSNLAIKGGRIYTMGQQSGENTALCLNAITGEEIWRQPLGDVKEPQATPTLDGGRVYVLEQSGVVCCLNSKDGNIRWEKDLVREYGSPKTHWGYAGSPVVEGNLLIVNARTSGIALDKKTGEKVWHGEIHTDTAGDYFSTPVVYDYDDRKYILMLSNSGLFSMEVDTGNKLWFFEWKGKGFSPIADPVLFERKAFLSAGESNLHCILLDLDASKPRVIWRTSSMRNHISTCIYLDGYLYGCDGDVDAGEKNRLCCVDAQSGTLMWEEEMIAPSLIAAKGKLIIIEESGTLHIADATSKQYSEISRCALPSKTGVTKWWTPPVLYRGRLFCRNYAGDLVCIDVRKTRS
jgi:outer membrane protein assembly factor BamB